ncbi:MAG TPA: GntR family transcriptional regulator [Conexibacter sp.]|nr:GntR family transcriptional regulator [Conexibacter sp.]
MSVGNGTPQVRPRPLKGIDRQSFVPLYFQLAEVLKERIEFGAWRPGHRLPSEKELIAEFGVSRTVIRPALALLESDGQLVRVKGRGTFVAQPKTGLAIEGLVRMLSRPASGDAEIRVLSASEQDPEPGVAEVLTPDADAICHATVVLHRDGRPIAICNSFSSLRHAPWTLPALRERKRVTADALPLGDVALAAADVHLQTAYVSHWEATQLGLSPGAGCYLVRCIERLAPPPAARDGDARATAIELARIVYPLDSVEFDLRVARTPSLDGDALERD